MLHAACSWTLEAEAKVTWAILRVVMRCVPVTPMLNDWVRLGPNLDFFLCAEFQSILTQLLLKADWAMQLPQQDLEGETVFIEWRKLAGSRYHRTRKVLVCAEERFQRTLLAIVVEPLRHLHSTFLKYAHTAPDDESWPALLQQIWAPSSKFTAVLQYYSSMLAGRCARLRLVWQLTGCPTMSEWMTQQPEQARQARNLILLVAASVHRRFAASLDRYPFKLFAVADARRDDREEIVNQFYQKSFCCLPAGFAREVRKTVSKEDFVRNLPHFRWFVLMTAFITKLTIASVERRHATHQQQANKGMPFPMFSAGSVLTESRHQASALERMKTERLRHQQIEQQAQQAPEDQLQPIPKRSATQRKKSERRLAAGGKVIRAQTALDLYKSDWLSREKVLGRQWNPASKECWESCKLSFASLPEDEKASLEERARASKLEAFVNRQVLKRMGNNKRDSLDGEILADAGGPVGNPEGNPESNCNVDRLAIMIQQQAAPEVAMRRQPPMPKHVACQSLLSPLEQQARVGDGGCGPRNFPISPLAVREQARMPGGLTKGIETFGKHAATIAGGQSLPDQVTYPGCCGALCRMQNTQRTLKLHKSILDALQKVVAESGFQPACFSQASLILAAEQYFLAGDDSASKTSFFALAHASGRQAHHKPQVTLAQLDSVSCPSALQVG